MIDLLPKLYDPPTSKMTGLVKVSLLLTMIVVVASGTLKIKRRPSCSTVPAKDTDTARPCVFPFRNSREGAEYSTCDEYNSCATEVDAHGVYTAWGYCNDDCKKYSYDISIVDLLSDLSK